MNPSNLAWLALLASVVAEVLGTLALRAADGLTKPWPSIAVVLCYGCAIWLMSVSVRQLEMGLAYAVWAGSGTALTAAIGMLCFQEAFTWSRLLGLTFIVLGVLALNLSTR
ncbi:multidrug efflux SMR transporter [Aquabacterium soli]|uniref:Multidrug efflux SMR transporter n=1 Tax=Aquabacterium soli TaxID=2493092 RepID=A0A3R8S9C1_9BURK|nr:multidrug efflux SMR transporter [Aquabacterium soli]RRS04519.1 multidrug efflux SMR transporter [Aquabacterium soli]